MERDSFVVYKSFLTAIKRLKRRDIQGELALAIIEYGITGVMTECGEIVELAMELIKPQIEVNNQKYLNGKKGGNPNFKKGETNPYYNKEKDNQKITKGQPKDNQKITKGQPNVNVNDNDIIIERESHTRAYTREEENTKTEKDNFSSEVKKYAEMDNETFFLEIWKKARTFYLKKETNIPKLSFTQKQNLEDILKNFTRRELWDGIHGLMIQDVSDLNGGNTIKLTPEHFLRYENFTKYLNVAKTNEQLYIKNQTAKQTKGRKREIGDL